MVTQPHNCHKHLGFGCLFACIHVFTCVVLCVYMHVHTYTQIRPYRSRNALRLGASGAPALRGARSQEKGKGQRRGKLAALQRGLSMLGTGPLSGRGSFNVVFMCAHQCVSCLVLLLVRALLSESFLWPLRSCDCRCDSFVWPIWVSQYCQCFLMSSPGQVSLGLCYGDASGC